MANTTPSSPTNTNVSETATLTDNNNVVVVPAVTSETVVVSLLDDGTDNDGGAVPVDTTENRDETTAVTNTAEVVIPIPTNCPLPPVVVTAETFFAALPGMMTGEESTTPTEGGEGSSQAPPPPQGGGAEFTIVYCPTTGNGMYMTPPVQPRGEQKSNIPPSLVSATATTVPARSSAPESSQRRNPPPPCQVCNKRYTSWKALFGHMRSHPDRSWRGVHPPPRFDGHRQRGNNPIVLHA